jgi:serine phosphatase RsbU (regulator of sigma subunit)
MKAKASPKRAAAHGKDDSRHAVRVPTGPGRTRASGMGVATQFAFATALTVAVSMIVFGFALYQQMAGTLSQEIDAQGVAAARAAAVTDIDCWKPYHGTALEGQENDKNAELPTDPHQREKFERRRDANVGRVRRMASGGDTKILDAAIFDLQESILNGPEKIGFNPDGTTHRIGAVEVQGGSYTTGGRMGLTRARLYRAPITSAYGAVAGYAVVAISAERIDEALSDLTMRLILLTLLFIAVGAVVAWFVAKRVTRPISLLCDDIETVARGDLEHRTPARSNDEIGVLARTFDRMTQNLLGMQDLERQQAAQEHQIEVAREVQAALLPEQLPPVPGYEVAVASRPAQKIAGDFYDVSDMAGGAKLLAVVSSSGAGIPGAMVVTMARSLLKALAPGETSPAELLRKVNRLLAPDLRRGMYVSALLVRADPAGGKLLVANAGHHPLLVCRRGAAKAEPFHSDGIALGFDKGPVFDRTIKDRELALAAGDRALLCTRSIFAARDAAGTEIGEERVYSLFAKQSARRSAEFVDAILNALETFREGAATLEDITFLTIRWGGSPAPPAAPADPTPGGKP